ncbi:MAG: cupin domain-containing protein [Gemmataceae bacterium]|nr:cupin domain-containing protein [Gemmataceae bacterium]
MNTNVMHSGQGRSFWVVGDRYTLLATGEDTGGSYALIEALVPPGGGPPPHIHHREDEAFYVIEGELAFHADGQSYRAGPGAWVTLAKGSLHHFKNEGAGQARMLIVVHPAGLEKFFAEVGREATGVDSGAGVVTPAEIEKLLAVAPRYGIEIRLPKG